eukprot:3999925-Prymnesium_polylepis.1
MAAPTAARPRTSIWVTEAIVRRPPPAPCVHLRPAPCAHVWRRRYDGDGGGKGADHPMFFRPRVNPGRASLVPAARGRRRHVRAVA